MNIFLRGMLIGSLLFIGIVSIFTFTHTKLIIVSTDKKTDTLTFNDEITGDNPPNQEAAAVRAKKKRAVPIIATTTVSSSAPFMPTTPSSTLNQMKIMAWIYPGNPACSANTEYADGRKIDVLKSEFFTISGGLLSLLTTANSFCNGYSVDTISRLKQYSSEQYATVSGASTNDIDTFLARALSTQGTDIAKLVDFSVNNNITGIELDFEDFSGWSANTYANYKKFATLLGDALHAKSKKLIIDAPAISGINEESWYLWRYSDFITLPIDSIVVMAYDYQFDNGVGSPITPLDWLKNVANYTVTKYPKEKITIGLPSYGYQGTVGTYRSSILTFDQIKSKPGYLNAARDIASGEMTWQNGTTIYFFQDAQSLNMKRDVIAKIGITSVSLWHLGGSNPWF